MLLRWCQMQKHTTSLRSRWLGFSLIELMMTIAIIAVLASVAYGSYTKQVYKSHRTEAKTALLDLAGREERLYATTSNYSNSLADLNYGSAIVGSGYYSVRITNVAAGPPATFTLTATPIGAQVNDTECGNFILDQTGAQSVSGTGTNCW
jgi:type IV pilus assembly protein PilE